MLPSQALYIAWYVADFLRKIHLYAKAIDFYEECLVLLRITIALRLESTFPQEPSDIEWQLCMSLGEAYSKSGLTEKAIEMCKECLKINKEAGNKRRDSKCYENIGVLYFNLGQCEKSISYHEKALGIRKLIKEKVLEASSYNSLCLVYGVLGQYEKALGYAEKALEIGKGTGDRATEGVAYTNLSCMYCYLGQYEKAIEYQEIELTISKETGDCQGEGTCYNNLGGIYFQLSQYNKSIEYLEKGLKIVREIGFRQGEGESLLNLAQAYCHLGKYAKSLEYCEKALSIMRSLGCRNEEGSAYLTQAAIYSTLGEYKKSVECNEKALAITTMMGDKKGLASCYGIFGVVYGKLCQYEKSIKFLEQSYKISEEIGDLSGQAVTCNNLACTYYSVGSYEKSIEYFQKDLQISKSTGDRYGEGIALCGIGNSYYVLDQLEKSLEYQRKALNILKEIGSITGEKYVSYHLGVSNVAARNLPKAMLHLRKSIKRHEKMRARLKDEHQLSLDDENIKSYRLLCFLLATIEQPMHALFVSEQGRARGLVDLLSTKYGVQEVSNARALNLSAMRVLFTHRQRTNFLVLGTPLGTIMLWFVNKDGKMSFFSFNERDLKGNDLEHQLNELIVSISHSLEEVRCEDRSLDACYEKLLPAVANRSKEAKPSQNSREKEKDDESRFHLLFMMIISPIFDRIDSPEIIIVPEGPLFLIPFSALKDSSGGYLSETVRIRLIPSLTTLKLIQDSPADYHCQSGALIVGDPKVSRVNINGKVVELCPLPKAKEEAQMVSAMLGEPSLVGEQATKEEVLRRIQEVSLVHIAAHGDAERGEIALAPSSSVTGIPKKEDIMLTMKDIADVRIRAKLVVLSCCHSARGKILKAEGVVGIARAFLGSGARSVLMSLWAVDDEATKAFMDKFYKSLIDEKRSSSEALHHSIKKMRESPEYKDLKYWAPFVLLGDDVRLDLNE